jgi:hypothetical protein
VVAIARTSHGVESLFATAATITPLQLSPRTHLSPRGGKRHPRRVRTGKPSALATVQTFDALGFDLGGALQAAWASAKAAVPVLVSCVKRFVAKRDHGLTYTVVEEVLRALYLANAGSSIWEEMKRETAEPFGADPNRYSGTAVIEELCALVKQQPQTKVTLVGHSTGAIYIGNFLHYADAALTARGDTTTQFGILLMAPANTIDVYARSYTSRVLGIRIFQNERRDRAAGPPHVARRRAGRHVDCWVVYPRSLLYLVSGIAEYFEGQSGIGPHAFDGDHMPLLSIARYYDHTSVFGASDYPNVAVVRSQFTVAPPPTPTTFVRVLSPTAPLPNDGYRSTSLKRGISRATARRWRASLWCFQHGLERAYSGHAGRAQPSTVLGHRRHQQRERDRGVVRGDEVLGVVARRNLFVEETDAVSDARDERERCARARADHTVRGLE